jgi:hypothetical protein
MATVYSGDTVASRGRLFPELDIWPWIPYIVRAMPRATPIRREKVIDEHGNILELAIWKVPPTGLNPAGIRYRLAFVRSRERTPVVLYDWHAPKGHHRHVEGVEEPYHFVDVDQLLADFTADVRRVTGDPTWPRR